MTAVNDSKTSAAKVKGVQVHATIDRDKFDALEDHRWDARLDMVSLVKLALDEYGAKRKLPAFLPAADAPAADKGASPKA